MIPLKKLLKNIISNKEGKINKINDPVKYNK